MISPWPDWRNGYLETPPGEPCLRAYLRRDRRGGFELVSLRTVRCFLQHTGLMVPDTSAPCAPVEGEPWLGVVQVGERPLLETQITGLREDSPFEVVAEK